MGAWILADEVYRGAEFDGSMTTSFWGGYERILCTAGLSKAFSLPGLRTGWVVGAPKVVEKLWGYHDYTSVESIFQMVIPGNDKRRLEGMEGSARF